MFEKSLYDLIRGLRNHRGKEREYIQASIRECRAEIKSQDMDLKATAVLKLTYLEMFGHDMSWASFNILEVMSSPKYLQKRVGYLGAVQSFRPDTEVLMLAENLLKKDLASTQMITIGLPLGAIPHVVNPSMANSLLSDLLSRLTHSSPNIRKKTIVTLYRLALVYPETLRPAWPKIKERLADENEEPSVTSAVVNVVCELGWRRPHDFLPLAPRLFDLLVSGGNNWMAIKIIKLFATLCPLEPRLVNKLLPPLTQIIKTTPAMSLLYECINGIIQGGVLEAAQGTTKGDEIARLCVGKLRGMLMIEGDPNLKYVALLAFNRIVELHPYLVTTHEDVVIECIDDVDISIRLRALDLVVGMVNPHNLTSIVDRLMGQLRNSPFASSVADPLNDRGVTEGVYPQADEDDSDMEQSIRPQIKPRNDVPPLPDDYRVSIIRKILSMCARDTYANVNDFDWYIEVLVQLVGCVPAPNNSSTGSAKNGTVCGSSHRTVVAFEVGAELRNIAVRVKSSREEATRAAELLISVDRRDKLFPAAGSGAIEVLGPSVWIVGEFAHLLLNPAASLDSLIHSSTSQLPGDILSAYLQAIMKLYAHLSADDRLAWTAERRTMVSLLTAKVSHFLESLTTHPNVEVQERAVEYLEISRLSSEAVLRHPVQKEDYDHQSPPLLLTQAIPALFSGMELNPVAKDAQTKVPIPVDLDLDAPINPNLQSLLDVPDFSTTYDTTDDFSTYYHQRPQIASTSSTAQPAAARLNSFSRDADSEPQSYQQSSTSSSTLLARKTARQTRHKDDPFYIPASADTSGRATPNPLHGIIKSSNTEALDVDSIPIMALDLNDADAMPVRSKAEMGEAKTDRRAKKRRKAEILGDETIDSPVAALLNPSSRTTSPNNLTINLSTPNISQPRALSRSPARITTTAPPRSTNPLQLDSSSLASLNLLSPTGNILDAERKQAEEADMAAAMLEVERLRLEMQRKAERIEGPGNGEGVVVKRRKKRVPRAGVEVGDGEDGNEEDGEKDVKKVKKKRKKKIVPGQDDSTTAGAVGQDDADAAGADSSIAMPSAEAQSEAATQSEAVDAPAKPKKKKKRREVTFDED